MSKDFQGFLRIFSFLLDISMPNKLQLWGDTTTCFQIITVSHMQEIRKIRSISWNGNTCKDLHIFNILLYTTKILHIMLDNPYHSLSYIIFTVCITWSSISITLIYLKHQNALYLASMVIESFQRRGSKMLLMNGRDNTR